MKYHSITKADMVNGEGLRVVLWVSGCDHNCPGCHNQLTWNPSNGEEFTAETKAEIMTELDNDWCDGLTLSGGDPLFKQNRPLIAELVKEIKEKYPTKTIWCYTGYTWEELLKMQKKDLDIETILNNIDVLVDGRFVLKDAFKNLNYVGSSNQKIISVPNSLAEKRVVLHIETVRKD